MKTPKKNGIKKLLVFAFATVAAATLPLRAGFVQNPSFESNYNPTWPHYGQPGGVDANGIDSWTGTGNYGINDHILDAGGPFYDNGATPDRNRVMFKQQQGDLSQEISGLTPGNVYWIQFYYNKRAGGSAGTILNLSTRFGGLTLDTVSGIQPAGNPNTFANSFFPRTVLFVPETDAGTLTFSWSNDGDASGLLDAVTIVERSTNDIVIMNPSFEASGMLPDVGPLSNLAGWAGTGVVGVDAVGGAYANNGAIPDQDLVAFIEGPGSLTQTVRNLVSGTPYQLMFAYNARTGNTPHLQVKSGTTVLWEGDVTPVGGSSPFSVRTVNFTPSTGTIVLSFEQTQAGSDVVLLDNIRLTGETQVPLPPMEVTPGKAELAPGQTVTISVKVPAEKLATGPADITLATTDLNVVQLVGGDTNGTLTLHFVQAGATMQTVDAMAVRRGNANVTVTDSAGLVVPNGVLISVVDSFVRNPSFEAEEASSGAGYGPVLSWTAIGGTGLNRVDQAFAVNSGPIPDRFQVAFIQGSGSLSQPVAGLTAGGLYALQFRYSLRDFPDPAGPAIDLTVRFGGQTVASIPNIVPLSQAGAIAYFTTNVLFTPTNANGLLEFVTSNPKGDATALLDAVSIVRRSPSEIMLQNPSFEASGSMALYNGGLTSGWETSGGGRGTDSDGPFADNGLVPDQDQAFFLQGAGFVQQVVSGLTTGEKYTLVYSVNARGCCPATDVITHYIVQTGTPGAPATVFEEDISPAGAGRPYLRRAVVFTADNTEQVVRIEHVPAGDRTLLVDNVRLLLGEITVSPSLTIRAQPNGSLQITWTDTTGGLVLESAPDLNGGWAADPAPVTNQGAAKVATVAPGLAPRFYRLGL
jgi:hypothetical protein